MSADFKHTWAKCCDFIRDNIGVSRFNMWFSKTEAISFDGTTLTLELPTHFYYEKYEDSFYGVLSAAIKKEFGPDVQLNYRVRMIAETNGEVTLPHSGKSKVVGSAMDRARSAPANPLAEHDGDLPDIDSQLNPALNFENYCIGDSNRLASTIALAIAENPKNSAFNPCFLYGDVGVGKTHLVQAIGIRVKEHNPKARVLYTTARLFQHLYATAAIEKKIPDFISWFMSLDMLIIDDLQEIAHKTKTSEVLFPIFNHLHQHGKQLVFTCDRPPMELEGVTDRLIDRFKWGVTERLPRPDATLRKKILTYKAERNGLALSEDVIDFIARHAVTSVREIEGIVMGMLTRSISLNCDITLELAREVLKNTVKVPDKKPLNFDMIVEATAENFHLDPDVIFSKSRLRDIADARQVVMYLSSKMIGLSSNAIGQKLNRKHTTVLHGIEAVKDRIRVAPDFSDRIMSIESDLV